MEASLSSYIYGQLSYHLIFVTKYRRQVLKFKGEVKLVLDEITLEHKMKIYAIEVLEEHVRLFISIHYTMSISTAIQLLKGKSAYLIFKSHPEIKQQLWGGHLWSRGKFIRSVGSVTEEAIRRYITQKPKTPLIPHPLGCV